jgi:CubicO group peptidase (beta-lactamase class C family)/D-alanyl-D-alanine dipeptidase
LKKQMAQKRENLIYRCVMLKFRVLLIFASFLVIAGVAIWRAAPLLASSLSNSVSEISASAQATVNSSPRPDYAKVVAALEEFIEREMKNKQLPALSIALVDDQQIVWAQGFGYADPAHEVKATARTEYRVGSVSKLFTDIAIMQLVERGEVDLDDPIEKYLPDFHPHNPFGKPITLRELMTHHAGLVREPPVGSYFDTSEPPVAEVVKSLNNTELVYEPGTHEKYSNAGPTVVGYLLERLKQQPYQAYLKHALLEPMGLTESSFEPEPSVTNNVAKATMWTYDGREFPAPTFELGTGPAGNMYSTVTDMGRFLSVLFNRGRGPNGPVLKPETLEEMFTPQFAQPGAKVGFGLGFHMRTLEGLRVFGHAGGVYGFATQLSGIPDDKLGVIVVTTMESCNEVTLHVANVALHLMLAARAGGPLPPTPVTTDVPPEEVQQLVGRYEDGEKALDMFERENNNKLFVMPLGDGGQSEVRRLEDPLSKDHLITDDRHGWGWHIWPIPDGIKTEGSSAEIFKRVPNHKPIAPPQEWSKLIGEYGWDHDVLYVLERNNHLTALIEWFEYVPLEPVSGNVWLFPENSSYDHEKLTFATDANGYATQLKVGEVVFPRRPIGSESGSVFRIQPVRLVKELQREALRARPPVEHGAFRKPDLVSLPTLDSTIKLDIRYATSDNFLSTPVYAEARAFLQRPAAQALVRAQEKLRASGYGLLIYDAYRPWYVTKIFWDATPDDKHVFTADPHQGSKHNRGCAVDLSLYDIATGKPVDMVDGYDEMSPRSNPYYPGGTSLQRWQRDLLREAMESEGFAVDHAEWWHFDYKDWPSYPILNKRFEDLRITR